MSLEPSILERFYSDLHPNYWCFSPGQHPSTRAQLWPQNLVKCYETHTINFVHPYRTLATIIAIIYNYTYNYNLKKLTDYNSTLWCEPPREIRSCSETFASGVGAPKVVPWYEFHVNSCTTLTDKAVVVFICKSCRANL